MKMPIPYKRVKLKYISTDGEICTNIAFYCNYHDYWITEHEDSPDVEKPISFQDLEFAENISCCLCVDLNEVPDEGSLCIYLLDKLCSKYELAKKLHGSDYKYYARCKYG